MQPGEFRDTVLLKEQRRGLRVVEGRLETSDLLRRTGYRVSRFHYTYEATVSLIRTGHREPATE